MKGKIVSLLIVVVVIMMAQMAQATVISRSADYTGAAWNYYWQSYTSGPYANLTPAQWNAMQYTTSSSTWYPDCGWNPAYEYCNSNGPSYGFYQAGATGLQQYTNLYGDGTSNNGYAIATFANTTSQAMNVDIGGSLQWGAANQSGGVRNSWSKVLIAQISASGTVTMLFSKNVGDDMTAYQVYGPAAVPDFAGNSALQGLTLQPGDKIAFAVESITSGQVLSTLYDSGVTLNVTPEPCTIALLGLGGLVLRRYGK